MTRSVTIDFSEHARARKVISRSNHRVTGKYPGFKSGRMHHWESLLEQDAFRQLDADVNVISFSEQPAKLLYLDHSDIPRAHYPDILVTTTRGREFVEVKTDGDAVSPEVSERTILLQPALAREGYGYRVWPTSEIRRHTQIPNIKLLLRFGRKPVTAASFERIRRLFRSSQTLPWRQVTAPVQGCHALADVARLVLDGHLQVDLDYPIDDDTQVTFLTGGRYESR